jgi:uncharacterized protein (TIGR02453 family)
MTSFQGVPADFLPFLRELHERQDKEWLAANKKRYEAAIKTPMRALVAATNVELAAQGMPLSGDPSRSVSRINRDVRFSADKRVYKDHSAATFTRVPGEMSPGLLYVHLGVEEAFAGIGFYAVGPEDLAALRQRIADRPMDWVQIEAALAASGHAIGAEESLKRVPRGFEAMAGGPVADALRRKGQTCKLDLRHDPLDAGLPDRLASFAAKTSALLTFGWGH